MPFVRFVYDVSWPFVAPFHGSFNTDQIGRTAFEPECLVAAAIYTLIAWGVVSLTRLLTRPPSVTAI